VDKQAIELRRILRQAIVVERGKQEIINWFLLSLYHEMRELIKTAPEQLAKGEKLSGTTVMSQIIVINRAYKIARGESVVGTGILFSEVSNHLADLIKYYQ
jgi:hypothetical protein